MVITLMMTMNIAMMRMTTTDPSQEAMRTATAIHTRRGIIIMGIQPLVTMSNSTMTMITTCGDQQKHHLISLAVGPLISQKK